MAKACKQVSQLGNPETDTEVSLGTSKVSYLQGRKNLEFHAEFKKHELPRSYVIKTVPHESNKDSAF